VEATSTVWCPSATVTCGLSLQLATTEQPMACYMVQDRSHDPSVQEPDMAEGGGVLQHQLTHLVADKPVLGVAGACMPAPTTLTPCCCHVADLRWIPLLLSTAGGCCCRCHRQHAAVLHMHCCKLLNKGCWCQHHHLLLLLLPLVV
jgi:hypothetical protein